MVRDRCALFHSRDRSNPIERMCEPGDDWPEPMRGSDVEIPSSQQE